MVMRLEDGGWFLMDGGVLKFARIGYNFGLLSFLNNFDRGIGFVGVEIILKYFEYGLAIVRDRNFVIFNEVFNYL